MDVVVFGGGGCVDAVAARANRSSPDALAGPGEKSGVRQHPWRILYRIVRTDGLKYAEILLQKGGGWGSAPS